MRRVVVDGSRLVIEQDQVADITFALAASVAGRQVGRPGIIVAQQDGILGISCSRSCCQIRFMPPTGCSSEVCQKMFSELNRNEPGEVSGLPAPTKPESSVSFNGTTGLTTPGSRQPPGMWL